MHCPVCGELWLLKPLTPTLDGRMTFYCCRCGCRFISDLSVGEVYL